MPPSAPRSESLRLYVGTYTRGGSRGIYALRLDLADGTLSRPEPAADADNPSFLALSPCRRFLYAVSEVARSAGRPSGAVRAFAADPASGRLTPLNQQPSGGAGPCHLIVDSQKRNVLVANYSSGSVAVLPIGPDGRLGPPSCVVQHHGSGPDRDRQEGPHAHSVNLDPAGRFAFVADLGLDQVLVYRYDDAAGKIQPHDPPAARVAPGAGPRHLAFHPSGRFVYVINEMASTVTAFAFDPAGGAMSEVQTLSTLPPGWSGETTTAEVAVHPSGRFLYGSNRGHDSIAVFAIDADSGRLAPLACEPTLGAEPRHFALDPAGRFLVAANQDSDTLVPFRIDAATGRLAQAGPPVNVPSPVCVRFVPPPT